MRIETDTIRYQEVSLKKHPSASLSTPHHFGLLSPSPHTLKAMFKIDFVPVPDKEHRMPPSNISNIVHWEAISSVF